MNCATCGLPVIDPETFDPYTQRYADTPGGHADRHTLVVEAAHRIVQPCGPCRLADCYACAGGTCHCCSEDES